MKRFNIFQRILAVMLMITLMLSGIVISPREKGGGVVKVKAAGVGDGTAGDNSGHFSQYDSGKYKGVGWRITLIYDSIIDKGSDTVVHDLKTHLSSYIGESILVTSYNGSVICYPSRGTKYVPQTTVKSIKDIFPDINSNGFTADLISGEKINLSQCNDFFKEGGIFSNYIGENKEKAINEFCRARGITLASDYSNICFAVEPVLLFKYHSYPVTAMSYQDCLGNQEGTAWSNAFNWSIASSTSTPNAYLGSNGKGATRAWLQALWSAHFSFIDTVGVFGTAGKRYKTEPKSRYSGFYIYGAGINSNKPVDPVKTATAITMLYGGDATESGKGVDIRYSVNMMDDRYTGTIIDYNTLMTAADYALNMLPLASSGTALRVTDDERNFLTKNLEGDALLAELTGISDTSIWTDYSYVDSTIGGINYSEFDSIATRMIVRANKTSIDDLKNNLQLTSTVSTVTGADINIGKTYNLTLNNGNITGLSMKTYSALSDGGPIYNGDCSFNYTTDMIQEYYPDFKASDITQRLALTALKDASKLKSVTPKRASSRNGSEQGISLVVLAKKNLLDSYVAYATLNRDTGVVTYDTQYNKKLTYDVAGVGKIGVPDDYTKQCVYIIFPNTGSYSLEGDNTGSEVYSQCTTDFVDEEDLVEIVQNMGVSDIASFGSIRNGQTIYVGNDGNGTGYSILVLQLTGNVVKGSNLELKDYELNYIYPSMLTKGNYSTFADVSSAKKLGMERVYNYYDGDLCYSENSVIYEEDCDDKTVKASTNYAGNIIDWNKKLGTNKNILRNDEYTGGIFEVEEKVRKGYTFSDNLTNIKFSLAVNLTRSAFDKNVVISSISTPSISDKSYITQNLGFKIANKPSGTITNADSKRNSNALVGAQLKDIFEWDLTFNDSNSSTSLVVKEHDIWCHGRPHTEYWWSSDENGNGYWVSYSYNCGASDVYYTLEATDIPASSDGKKVKYVIKEKAYKYQTEDDLGVPYNTSGTIPGSLQKPVSGANSTSSVMTNPYKIAVVHASDKTLGFYPEVAMRAYSSQGDTITASNGIKSHTLYAMGEVKRKLKPSSMYLITVDEPNGDAVTGTVKSDSMAVGSNASNISNGLPVIYAGGDVSLFAEAEFVLNLYGYSLDLIEPTDTQLTGTGNYTSVIADGSDIKTAWDSSNSSYDAYAEFEEWVNDVVGKIAIDATLTVNGDGVNKKYNNFSSSVGYVGDTTPIEAGVFSIRIKEGTIVKDGGYQAMITQLKEDYKLASTQEAEALFKKSDIYQTIEKAIEDSNDAFNRSQSSSAIADRDHWYDEEVKTFVIRRFKSEDIEIRDVLINDKIDYGAAPTSSTTTSSVSGYKKATAQWYLTLYFSSLPNDFSPSTVYNPATNSGLQQGLDGGTVLVPEIYVKDADFVIPSASTHDMAN